MGIRIKSSDSRVTVGLTGRGYSMVVETLEEALAELHEDHANAWHTVAVSDRCLLLNGTLLPSPRSLPKSVMDVSIDSSKEPSSQL